MKQIDFDKEEVISLSESESTAFLKSLQKDIEKKEEDAKPKSKLGRFWYAIKNPSPLSQVGNNLFWTIGMSIGICGGSITLLIAKSYWFGVAGLCGFVMIVSSAIPMIKQFNLLRKQSKEVYKNAKI